MKDRPYTDMAHEKNQMIVTYGSLCIHETWVQLFRIT